MLDLLLRMLLEKHELSQAENRHRIYLAVSNNIERENALINYRITWAIILSVGILATEGIVLPKLKSLDDISQPLIPILIFNAFILSFAFTLSIIARWFSNKTINGVNAALKQIDYIRDHYYKFQTARKNSLFEVYFAMPRPFGDDDGHDKGHASARAFPHTMYIIWTIFTVIQFASIISYCLYAYWEFDRAIQQRRPIFELGYSTKQNSASIPATPPPR